MTLTSQCHNESNIMMIVYKGHTSKLDRWLLIYSLFISPLSRPFIRMVHCAEPETNMSTSFHIYSIYGIYFRDIYVGGMCIEVPFISQVHQPCDQHCTYIFQIQCTLLASATKPIWLSHVKNRFHCPHSI